MELIWLTDVIRLNQRKQEQTEATGSAKEAKKAYALQSRDSQRCLVRRCKVESYYLKKRLKHHGVALGPCGTPNFHPVCEDFNDAAMLPLGAIMPRH